MSVLFNIIFKYIEELYVSLNTLSVGDHVLSIVSNNGTATTTFKVVKGVTSEAVVPDTGIGSNM